MVQSGQSNVTRLGATSTAAPFRPPEPSSRISQANAYREIPERVTRVLDLRAKGHSEEVVANLTGLSPAAVRSLTEQPIAQSTLAQLRARALDATQAVREKFEGMSLTAAETVEEIMCSPDVPAKTRLSAAQLTLGIVGISPVAKSESLNLTATVTGDTLDGIRMRLQAEAQAHAARIATLAPQPLDNAPASEAELIREANVVTPLNTVGELEESRETLERSLPVVKVAETASRDAVERAIYAALTVAD